MKKVIVLQTRAEGLGLLLMKGAEATFATLPLDQEYPHRKRRVVLITAEGSTDPNEKTIAEVLSSDLLNEEDKPAKKDRHLKQLFKRALGSAADVVIIDNGFEELIDEKMCKEEAKTFEYDAVQFVNIGQYLPFAKEENSQPTKKGFWS